jgi:hypothetical protein
VLLIVDGANVMGSRPDGWWKDRAGAAGRLAAQLLSADLASLGDRVVLVLEGQARSARVPAGLEVVLAPRDGDSTILDLAHSAQEPVRVVTADRELTRLLTAVGAEVIRPGRLLPLL